MSQTELANTTFGVPGLFFDQEYGLLAYAPAYVLAGFGLWTMVRRPGPLRRVGLEVGVAVRRARRSPSAPSGSGGAARRRRAVR